MDEESDWSASCARELVLSVYACVSVWMHVYVRVCMHVHACVCTRVHACVCMCACECVCTCVRACVHMQGWKNATSETFAYLRELGQLDNEKFPGVSSTQRCGFLVAHENHW